MFIYIILFYVICIYFEFKYCLVNGDSKSKVIYSVLMVYQLILSLVIYFEIEITTPIDLMERFVKSLPWN